MTLSSLIFRYHSRSRYSIAALIGAIEIDSRLTVLDVVVKSDITSQFIRRKMEQGTVAIAHSVMSTQVERVKKECRKVKDNFGESVILIGGGPHASARPSELLEMGFDYVIIGEGERTLTELLWHLLNDWDPTNIPGLVTEESGNIPMPRELELTRLDMFPPFALEHNIVGPIEITRGCPFRCKFCSTPFLSGGVVRHRSVENIVFWLEKAVKVRGFCRAWFLSPNALCYGGKGIKPAPGKLEHLLKKSTTINGLSELYVGSFPSEIRPEFVDGKILQMLREYVANKTIQIGLQSGSNRMLQITNRHHSVEEGINAVEKALDAEFVPQVDMIFGLPGETKQDCELSLKLCYDLVEMGAKIHAHVFMPLPGSDFENMPPGRLDKETRRVLGDLARRGFVTGAWGNQEKLAQQLAKK